MTRDDLAKMYEKANGWSPASSENTMDDLERFVALVAAAEREACAKVADEWQTAIHDPRYECDCATAIRARGQG